MELLKFQVADVHCAIQLANVLGVELAAELTPLPGAPIVVAGCLNYRGDVLPVMRVAALLGLPEEPMRLEDRFIVVNTSRRSLVLWVDTVEAQVMRIDEVKEIAVDIAEGISHLSGVCRIEEDVFYITDIESFLNNEENRKVEEALNSVQP